MFANVIIEHPVKALDKPFSYKVPLNLEEKIKVGMKVKVPFGKQIINGVVVSITKKSPDYDTKEIESVENAEIYLTKEQLFLAKYLKEETLCPLIVALQTMLPPALKIKTQKSSYEKFDTFVKLNVSFDEVDSYIKNNPRSLKQIEILEKLKNGKVLKKEFSASSVKVLLDKNIIVLEKVKKYRIDYKEIKSNKKLLNEEQQKAYDEISQNLNSFNTYLLHGVTGSGKTEVYMQLIDKVIKNEKSAIVLVPEICLTTQTVQRFYDRFGKDVAIFHSALSAGEKYDEYLKIYKGEVKIVVGTRSSIFVPFENLGIIIIDEEHSETYKQESSPRYDAISMAKFRAKFHNIPLVLASATPSLESQSRAGKNVYKLVKLTKRVNTFPLPSTQIIDMAKESQKRNTILSEVLKEKIENRLNKNEQIILLLNRRGFSTFVSCSNCGFNYKCPNCDITLTFHKTTNNLRCHLCGYFQKKDDACPKCHENALNYLGLGTQKVEEYLLDEFKGARIVRMDQDTTSKKGSYQKIIDDFADYKYDILLGTQMISKGLDFENVTLVGVINADTTLNIPDFRANEKTFALLYQTSGRCGRHDKKGEVIIQTFNPDNEVLNYVKNNDYQRFYLYEMNIRHKLKYPPYVFIAVIKISSKDYEKASKESTNIKRLIENKLDKKTVVLGPTPASVFKINNIYNFQITIKYTFDDNLKLVLKALEQNYILDKNVNVDISFNPSHI